VKREGYQKPDDRDRYFEYYRPEGFRSLIEESGLRAVEFRTGENWISTLAKPDASP
jgi:hypothetical protein